MGKRLSGKKIQRTRTWQCKLAAQYDNDGLKLLACGLRAAIFRPYIVTKHILSPISFTFLQFSLYVINCKNI